MNKKIFIVLLILAFLFLVSCKEKTEEVTLKYTEADLETISLHIIEKDITINMSDNYYLKSLLSNLKLYKNDKNNNSDFMRMSKYVLSFSNYEITIYDNKTICYIDDERELDYLFTLNENELNYLDTLFESDLLDFSKYNENQIIKVFNSMEDSVEINEKEAFLEKLNKIKYIKLNNEDHYQLEELKFQILIDEELFNIYDNYIVIEDNLYILVEGNFSFLKNIQFSSSSGWLPWV